jgi:Dockerin type I domain
VVIVQHSMGPCDLCGADVNGDGTVDAIDLQIVQDSIGCTASGHGAQAGRRP